LRTFLTRWLGTSFSLEVSIRRHDDELVLNRHRSHRGSPREHRSNLIFAKELNGRFLDEESQDELILRVSFIAASEEDVALPCNVSFAILDDNLLVRRNAERMVSPSTLFLSRGRTREECMEFPQAIIEANVDIAIFDEHLDYFGLTTTIRGSHLAQRARELGFKGCIVLHSASSHVSSEMECIDGFVNKTTSRKEFMRGIHRAWMTHLERAKVSIVTRWEENSLRPIHNVAMDLNSGLWLRHQ